MPRIIRIVFSPQDEWRQIARERSHAALLYTFMMVAAANDAAQFVAIALVLAIVGSTLGGGAAGALGLL